MSDGEIVVKLSLDDGGYKVAVVSAGSVMKEFKRSLDSTATSMKRVEDAQFSMGRKFRDLVMTMGALRFVAMDVNDIFLRLPMAILKSAGELERMQVLMKGLSKELTEAGRATEGLRDFKFVTNMAKNAPFEITALSDSFVKLKTAGIDPTNGSMKALVDSVARFGGTGESLKRASVAIQQMAGKGVVSMEELRQQLGEAVPTAMQDMADGMGVSMQKLAKIVQTGTLEAGPAIAKMLIQMRVNNEGAAAEMMTTWVGMTSRLKTELQLAAKTVADAGFADEAKKVVKEMTDVLQSDEFARFAKDAGKGLGELVSDLAAVARAMIQYRNEIGLAIQAWAAYKVATSLVLPALRSVNDGFKGTIAAMRDQSAGAMANAVANRNMMAEMVASNLRAAEADSIRLAKKLANDQAELASVRARNQAILAEDRRMQAAMAVNGGVTIPGQRGFQSRAAGTEYMAELSRQNSAMVARERELATQVAATTAAMNASRSAVLQKATELGNLQNVTRMQTAASVALSTASRGLAAAIGFMGGPIGVTITAIMALVWWFQRAGAAADEAKARMDRATNNQGTKEDLKALTAELADAEQKLKIAQANKARGDEFRERNGSATAAQRITNAKAASAEEAAILEAEKRVVELRKALGETKLTVIENSGREQADRIDTAVRRVVNKLEEGSRAEILAIEGRQRDVLGTMKKDSKEYQDQVNKFNKEKQDALISGIEKRTRALSAAAVTAETNALKSADGSAERAGGMAAAKKMRADAEQLQMELDKIREGLAMKAGYKEKADKKAGSLGDKDSPFDRLVESIAQKRAQLDAELEHFNETEGKGDKAAGVMAKIIKQWEQNEFKDPKTGRNPTLNQIADAAGAAAQLERDKQDMKKREQLAQKAKEFASFVSGMEPEYLDALEVLMDPLSKVKMGRAEKRVDKMLMGMTPEELQAAAQKLGMTVDQVRAQLVNKAQTIDTVSFFQNVEQETKQINESLVDDSRMAAVKRMAADNERHAQEMRNLYEKRQASGEATGEELLQLQRIMEASVAARAARLAETSKTPFDKLASQWDNVTRNMEEATARWAEGTADAIGTMVTTGKMDFKGLAISIIADMAKIAAKAALSPIFKGVGSLFGNIWPFADGGIMNELGSVPLKKYANGGIANSPQVALYGEGKMPEAYVPLPDGRTIPVTLKGAGAATGGGDASSNVQINIVVNQDGSEKSDASGSPDEVYKRMGERIKSVVREELMNESRPGGVLYR